MVVKTRTRSPGDRVLSFFLALVFALSCVAVAVPSFSLKAKAVGSAKDSGKVEFDIGIFDYDVSLVETGNGLYKMTFNIASEVKQKDQNSVSTVATDGYFVADFSGQYLVELWGGNGANGDNDFGKGGKGGAGGHVYGYVYLNKGDILYYDLGGAGLQSKAPNNDTAANGGGTHGDQGNKKVGGGGGYSAVYLFRADDATRGAQYFMDNYDPNGDGTLDLSDVTKEDWEIDRTSNYIMVAGAGGGGGAGRGAGGGVVNFLSGSDPSPDGGAGGSADGTAIPVSNGVVFAGADGKSSTKRDQGHVGKGGSNVPGEVNDTALGWWEGGQPNNWDGSAVSGVPGGYGAKGNFRGGGGGAGYCGGSGGIMKSALIPEDIGGGGGGSSFIASTVNGQSVDYLSVPNDIKNRPNPNEATSGGGYVDINYMGEEDQSSSQSNWLSSLYFSVMYSDYFDIESIESTTGTPGYDESSREAYVGNFALSDGGTSTITITFKPVPGFKGGNNVPLLYVSDDYWDPAPPMFALVDTTASSEIYYQETVLDDDVAYVNVPISNMTAIGETVEASSEGTANKDDLYTDNYSEIRNMLYADKTYDFIGSISEYYVKNTDGSVVEGSEVTPGAYTVGVTVEPKYSPAAVGKPVTTTQITATGYVDTAEKVTINGITYNTSKDISYDDASDTYTLTLTLESNAINPSLRFTQASGADGATYKVINAGTTDKTFTVPADGWYLIQAKGGKGGDGGKAEIARDAGITGLLDDKETGNGGAGGAGKTINGWYYFEKGTVLTVSQVGEDGPKGSDDIKTTSNNGYVEAGGGRYGTPTVIDMVRPGNASEVLLVAGAGGGGGGGAATTGAAIYGRRTHDDGKAGESAESKAVLTTFDPAIIDDDPRESTSGNGGKTQHNTNYSSTGGAGGTASRSFVANDFHIGSTGLPADIVDDYNSAITTLSVPSVQISLIGQKTEEVTAIQESLKNKLRGLSVDSYEFTQYFTDIQVTEPADYESCISVSETPQPVDGDDSMEYYKAELDGLTWTITFKTIDGFFGGNDIEAIKRITIKQTDDSYPDGFKRFAGTDYESFESGPTVMDPDQTDLPDSGDIMSNPKTDYVNHKLATPIEASVVTESLRVAYGTTVQFDELFDVSKNDWNDAGLKDDYVDPILENDFPDGGYVATANRSFTYTYGISPKSTTSKGIVDDIDTETYTSLHADVTVYSEVTTDLDHAEYFGPTEVDYGDNLVANLKAEAGYVNFQLVSITSGGETLVEGEDYTFDEEYGELTVYADSIKGTVVIEAKADPQRYHVYFVAFDENAEVMNDLTNVNDSTYPNNNGYYQGTFADVYEYAGEDITGRAPEITPELRDSKTGYQFKWDWGTDDGEALTEMPAYDTWVYGTFYPYTYTLTINYVDGDGNPVADPYVNDMVYYGVHGNIESPAVPGKELVDPANAAYDFVIDEDFLAANNVDITGGDITVNIEYKDKDHVLTLRFIDADTGMFLGDNVYVKFAETGTSYDITEANIIDPAGLELENIQYYEASSADKGAFYDTLPVSIDDITIDSDIIVDVYYIHELYTVTYNANGHGTAPAAETDKYQYNDKIEQPADPENPTGYTFDGWYREAECENTWDFANDVITEDTELFAKWNANIYEVTFVYNDLETASTTADIAYDSTYESILPAPERTGFAFAGWFTESTGGNPVTAGTVYSPENPADHTLYAQWTPLDFTVRFMTTNEEMFREYTQAFASSITVEAAVRAGYTFLGWSSNNTALLPDLAPAAVGTTISVPAGDVTYTAQWEENADIVVTVLDVDGDVVPDATVTLGGVGDATSNASGLATFEKPANGEYTVTAAIAGKTATADVTKSGNASDTAVTVQFDDYDITKPVVGSDYDNEWHKETVTLNFYDTVPTYGDAVFQYKDGDNWVDVPDGGLVVTGTNGEAVVKTVEVRAISASGITGDPTSFEVKIDNKAPEGTISFDGDSWDALTSPVSFDSYKTTEADIVATITSSDADSGVENTVKKYYVASEATDIADIEWTETADGTVTIPAENNKKFVVYAMVEDSVGNTFVLSSDGFTFDLVDPTVSAELVDPDVVAQSKTIAISNVADAESGIAKLEVGVYNSDTDSYSWTQVPADTTTYPIEVNGTYAVRATDGAGRETVVDNIVVSTIDKVAPVLELSAVSGTDAYASGTWTNKDVVITVSDTSETLGKTTFYYSTDGGTNWTAISSDEDKTASVTQSTDCENLVYTFKAESASGVPSAENVSITVSIDKIQPTCTAVLEENSWSTFLNKIDVFNIFFNEAKTGTITPADNASGVAETKFLVSATSLTMDELKALDEAAWDHTVTSTENSFIINDPDGNKILYVRVTDNAGNVAYISSAGMVYDTTDPVITVTANPFEDGEWVSDDTVTIAVNVADETSGIKSVSYAYSDDVHDAVNVTVGDDGNFTIPNSNIPNGEYDITVTVVDNADNSATEVIHVKRANDSSLTITDPADVTVTYGAEEVSFSTTAESVSGVKSYQWQKSENGIDGWENIDPDDNASAAKATLVIANPTVVADNDDYYRVVVTSKSDVTKTSDVAKLTVNKRELVISPKDQAYNFGTAASKTYEFPANTKTGDEFKYLAFADGKAPINGDEVVFAGQFVRENPDVFAVGHYTISSDTAPNEVKLTNDTVNGNYTLNINPETADFEIIDYVVSIEAELVGENQNGWYRLGADGDGVRVTAPEGYQIRRTANDSWADYFTVDDGEYDEGVPYFLKDTTTDAVTSQMTTDAFNQDTVLPEGTITIDGNPTDALVSGVSFDTYKAENITAAVDMTDVISGISSVKYYVADSELTADALAALDSDDWQAVENDEVVIPAADTESVVLYVMAEDVAGNVYFLSSDGYTFDLTPPTVSAVLEDPDKVEQTKTLTISDVDDPESGITKLEVGKLNTATGEYEWTEIEIPADTTTYPIESNGTYVVRATNGADSTTTTTDPIVVETVDRNVPAINVTAKTGSAAYAGDWTNQDVVITLEDASETLGKTTFYFSTDNGANWTAIESDDNDKAVITVSEDCEAVTYSFKAVSEAGKTANAADTVTVNRDTVAPTGIASIESDGWSTFVNVVDVFDIFYKVAKTGSIDASDESGTVNSGINKVYYIIKSASMTQEELAQISVWEDATANRSFMIDDPQGNKILYVLILDNAGNKTYISSEGIVFDHDAPEIVATPSFTEGEWTSASEVTITIDEIIDTVAKLDKDTVSYSYSADGTYDSGSVPATVNVPADEIADNGRFVIPNAAIPNGDYVITITASDKAGNTGTKTVNVMRADDSALVVTNPSDTTVTYGDAAATFTVNAECVAGISSYVWEKSENGSDTWTVVTSETDGITITTAADNRTSTLTVADPTVVADDGDTYRVTVTSGSGASKTSPAATLNVNTRQITVTPKDQTYLYGSDESTETVFPASETEYWEYYANLPESMPINNDPVTFEGQFIRAEGILPETYIIHSDADNMFRLADDSTGENVNGNYYLRIEPTSSDFVITEYNPDVAATLEGEQHNDWFCLGTDGDGVRITPPAGYKISTTNDIADGNWKDYLTVEDGRYNSGVNYYLRNVDTESEDYHAVSVMKTTAAFKQDTVNPSGSITIGEGFWDRLLETITFGIYKNDDVTASIGSSDNTGGSGVGAVEYYIDKSGSGTALTAEQLAGVTWTTGNAPTIAKADKDKFVVYARITDNAGNIYFVSSDGHVFDLTAPEIVATLSDPDKIEQAKTITVTSVTEAESGITKVEVGTFDEDSGEYIWTDITSEALPYVMNITENGKYAVRATNGAGTVATEEITVTTIDDTAPVLAVEATSNEAAYTGDWTTKNVVITVTDTSDTLGKTAFYVSTDGGTTWDAIESENDKQAQITVSDDCKDAVYTFKAISEAGVESAETVSATVNKDATKPVITATPSPAFSETEWTSADSITIAVNVSDLTSGVDKTSVTYSYTEDAHADVNVSASAIDADGNFTIPNGNIPNGEYDITIVVSDNAGNQNATTVHVRRSDSSSLTVNDPENVTVTYGADKATFTVTADSISGIKSYQWQKCESGLDATDNDNWTNYGSAVVTNAKTNKLDIANPTVVADNGDLYRVVVKNNAGVTKTSAPAQLTVLPFELVLVPSAQEHNYGTAESAAYEFPANEKTATGDFKYFTFADEKAPINGDAVEFEGKFVRDNPTSAEIGTYTISSDDVALKSGVEVNGNYTFTIDPPTATFKIKAYTPDAAAILVGTEVNGWYNLEDDGDGVRVTAPTGYEIKRTATDAWAPYFTVDDGEYDTGVTYFLRDTATGAESTEKVTASFKQDTAVPTGTITTERSTWDTFLTIITFGWYTNKDLNVNITADGTGSAVSSIKYYIANDAMTETEVDAITDWADYTQAVTIPKEDAEKIVVYAKLIDTAGNASIISSDGHVFDLVDPAVTSNGSTVEPGATVSTSGTRTVVATDTVNTENTFDSITAVDGNGDPVDAQHVNITDNSAFVSNDYDETYVITAVDKAGNEVTYTIIIKSIPTFIDELDNDWADPDNPTKEELAAAIAAIDELLETEGDNLDEYNGDVDQYKGQDEEDILNNLRDELLDELKAQEIADLTLAATEAINNVKDGKEGDDLSDDDNTLIADIEQALQDAIDAINGADSVDDINEAVEVAQEAFDTDVAKDFVNEHASDDNFADTYDTVTDPVDSDNADRVLSGQDEYDRYVANNPSVVEKINEYIAYADEAADEPYADYPSMVAAAEAVLDNAKDDAINDLEAAAEEAIEAIKDGKSDDELTPEEEALIQEIEDALEEAIKDIEDADSLEEVEKIVDETKDGFNDNVAEDFVNDHASDNDYTEPYDKDGNPVTTDNAEQIISGEDEYNGYSDEIKDKINDLINKGDPDSDDVYPDYPTMVEAAKDLVDSSVADAKNDAITDLQDAADEAIEAIKDGKSDDELTPEEEALIKEIEDALAAAIEEINNLPDDDLDSIDKIDDIVDETKDGFNDNVAEDFVNDHASDNDYTTPYDKDGNPVTTDNAEQIISGEDEYNGYSDEIKDKINDLINKGDPDSDDVYPDYPTMLEAAKDAVEDAVTDAKNDAITDLQDAADEAIKAIKDGKSDDELTPEEEALIQDIEDDLAAAIEEINNLPDNDLDSIDKIDDIVDETKDGFNDNVAEDFVNDHASNNDATNPYDKDGNPVTEDNADQIISGEDEYNGYSDEIKDKINDLINKGDPDSEDVYPDYPTMVEAAKNTVDGAVADAKDDAINDLQDAAEEAIEAIKDGKSDDELTPEEEALIQEIEDALADAIEEINNLPDDDLDSIDKINDIVDETKDGFDDNVAKDFVNDHASDNNYADTYDTVTDPVDSGNADRVLSGQDEYDGYSDKIKDKINEYIAYADEAADEPYADYPAMVAAAEAVLDNAKDNAIDELQDAAEEAIEAIKDGKSDDELTPEEEALIQEIEEALADAIDAIEDADSLEEVNDIVDDTLDTFDDKVAEDFVNDHASPNDNTNPYDKANDPADADNADQIISGEDEYNGYSDSIKDKIDELINQKSENSDDPYSGYPEMLEAAKDAKQALDDAKDDAKDAINDAADEAIEAIKDGKSDDELTPEEQALIEEIEQARDDALDAIDNADSADEINDIVDDTLDTFDDKVAEDFVNDHASPNDNTNPYDKNNDPADADNADQIISGEDEYNGYPQSVKDKIDELINQKSENSDDPYSGYPEMLEAAKDAKDLDDAKDDAKDAINDAADEAIEAIKDGKSDDELTPEEQALIDEIEQARDDALDAIDDADSADEINDIVDDTLDTFDDKVAEDFVNDHASDNDATDPYDKANNPADKDNADRIISGEDEYNSYPQSVKDKINDLIKQKSESSDEPYSGYPEMLKAAKDAIAEEPDDGMTLEEVVEEMVNEGYIRVDIQVKNLVDPDAENADNIDEIVRILSKEVDEDDVAVFNAGGHVEIVMTIREIPYSAYNEAAIRADGNILVKHIEIIIEKTAVDADGNVVSSKDITKVSEPITFVVPLGDAAKAGRIFYVYADHEGRALAQKTADEDGVSIVPTATFSNDQFSVFSIAYVDDTRVPPAEEEEEVAYTGDPTPILSTALMMFSSFYGIAFVGKKRKEEEELY